MNLSRPEKNTLDSCLRNLAALDGCRTDFQPDAEIPGESGRLTIAGPWGELSYRVLTRLRLTPRNAEAIIYQTRAHATDEKTLLVTDFLPQEMEDTFHRQGVEYIDAVGNAHLRQPPLFVEVSGRRRKAPPKRQGRAFQTAGMKLLFLLLQNPPAVRWTYRDLAAASGIALGAIGPILQELDDLGFCRGSGPGRELVQTEQLWQRWELGYAERLRPSLAPRFCRLPDGIGLHRLPQLLREQHWGDKVLLGGEQGTAALLTRPTAQRVVLHLMTDPLKLMLALRLVPNPQGPVMLLKRFGHQDSWNGWQPEGMTIADPLLLHAELVACGGGETEAARELRRRFLLPRLQGKQIE